MYYVEIQQKHSLRECSEKNSEVEYDLEINNCPDEKARPASVSSNESIKHEPIKRRKCEKKEDKEQSEKLISEHCSMDCQKCIFKFKNFEEMKDHYKTKHKDEGYLQCCSRKFFKSTKLLSHIKWHINPNVYQCSICNKTYREKSSMLTHQETHDKKTIKCNFPGCNRLYSSQNQLKVHSKKAHILDGQKPLECELCSKT